MVKGRIKQTNGNNFKKYGYIDNDYDKYNNYIELNKFKQKSQLSPLKE